MWNRRTASARAGRDGIADGTDERGLPTAMAWSSSPVRTARQSALASRVAASTCQRRHVAGVRTTASRPPQSPRIVGQVVGMTHKGVQGLHARRFSRGKQEKPRVEIWSPRRRQPHPPAKARSSGSSTSRAAIRLQTRHDCTLSSTSNGPAIAVSRTSKPSAAASTRRSSAGGWPPA